MNKGRKIYLNDWLEELTKNIESNQELLKAIDEEKYNKEISRDVNLLNKLEQYKKVDEEGHIYFFFFPSELEDIMWVLLENTYLGADI